MSDKLDRRAFAGLLAAGTTIPLAALALAQQTKPAEPKTKPADPAADAAAVLPEPPAREDLILELIKQTYPDRLQPEHLEVIRQEIRGNLFRSQLLGEFPLTNGDGPAFDFRAYRGPDVPKKV